MNAGLLLGSSQATKMFCNAVSDVFVLDADLCFMEAGWGRANAADQKKAESNLVVVAPNCTQEAGTLLFVLG